MPFIRHSALARKADSIALANATGSEGLQNFQNDGRVRCHTPAMQTSQYHDFAELRSKTPAYSKRPPYNIGPLCAPWLSRSVKGGITGDKGNNPHSLNISKHFTPSHISLNRERARSAKETMVWHGDECEPFRQAFVGLNHSDQLAPLNFLHSL